MKKKAILITYGTGGHCEQIHRLLNMCSFEELSHQIIALSESGAKHPKQINKIFNTHPIKSKYHKFYLFPYYLFTAFFTLIQTIHIYLRYDIKTVISTGPGFSLIPLFFFKTMGRKTIYIEDWCRFYSMSSTGRYAYKFVDIFYIQNKTLQQSYPKSKYCGLL